MSSMSGFGYTFSPRRRYSYSSGGSIFAGVFGVILFIALVCAILAVGPWLFMLAWNFVAPVFWPAAPVLTFWVSFVALFVLGVIGRTLFGRSSSN